MTHLDRAQLEAKKTELETQLQNAEQMAFRLQGAIIAVNGLLADLDQQGVTSPPAPAAPSPVVPAVQPGIVHK